MEKNYIKIKSAKTQKSLTVVHPLNLIACDLNKTGSLVRRYLFRHGFVRVFCCFFEFIYKDNEVKVN